MSLATELEELQQEQAKPGKASKKSAGPVGPVEVEPMEAIAPPPPRPSKPSTTRIDQIPNAPAPAPPSASANTSTADGKEHGLPTLPPELDNKAAIVKYINQYGVDDQDRKAIVYTDKERRAWERHQSSRGFLAAPKAHFVAALRMWHSGHFPIVKPERESLNAMAIE